MLDARALSALRHLAEDELRAVARPKPASRAGASAGRVHPRSELRERCLVGGGHPRESSGPPLRQPRRGRRLAARLEARGQGDGGARADARGGGNRGGGEEREAAARAGPGGAGGAAPPPPAPGAAAGPAPPPAAPGTTSTTRSWSCAASSPTGGAPTRCPSGAWPSRRWPRALTKHGGKAECRQSRSSSSSRGSARHSVASAKGSHPRTRGNSSSSASYARPQTSRSSP